jgi:hypothetical protein
VTFDRSAHCECLAAPPNSRRLRSGDIEALFHR